MLASAAAVYSLSCDVYEAGAFDEDHVKELFEPNAYGGLSAFSTVAKQIVSRFMSLDKYTYNLCYNLCFRRIFARVRYHS